MRPDAESCYHISYATYDDAEIYAEAEKIKLVAGCIIGKTGIPERRLLNAAAKKERLSCAELDEIKKHMPEIREQLIHADHFRILDFLTRRIS